MRPRLEGDPGLSGPGKLVMLLLAATNASAIPGATHLQKEAYVVSRAIPSLASDLGFDPYLMGPYSSALADEAEQLKLSELIEVEPGRISLTRQGVTLADSITQDLPLSERSKLNELKALLNDMSHDELLAFVYFGLTTEPIEEESEEYSRLSPIRVELARSLLRRRKVTIGRAAEIAGIPLEQFISSPQAQG